MRKLALSCTVSLLAVAATPAMAQDQIEEQEETSAGQSGPVDNDTIIVTANRRESEALRTPIALTAIGGEELTQSGVNTTSDLADRVPNLNLSSNNTGVQITIRGISNAEPTERGDPSAAFMIDEIYIGRTAAVETALFDINRVEVLRGPQGTLFGRNTTAGLIHVVSNRPTFTFGGSLDATVGNYGQINTTGVINAPVSDNFAVRAAVNYERRDSYINRGPLFTADNDPFKNNLSARLSGLYEWGSGQIYVRGDYSSIRGNTTDLLLLDNFFENTNTPDSDAVYVANQRSTEELLTVNAPITWDLFRRNNTWGISTEITQSLGPVDAVYVGGYREYTNDATDPRINTDGTLAFRLEFDGRFKQQSHELRFVTNGTGPIEAQVGAYYFKEDLDASINLLLASNVTDIGTTVFFTTPELVNESYAFFGQATAELADIVRLTAGVRYSNDLKDRRDGNTFICGDFDCETSQESVSTNIAKVRFDKVTWKLGADVDIGDTNMAFFNVSTGYKAGGFNDGCLRDSQPECRFTAATLFYSPEELTSYEAGLKGRLAGGAVRYSLTGFIYDYSNIQLFTLVPDCGGGASCSVTQNGGQAKVTGLEFESSVSVADNGRLDIAGTILDARFTEFSPDGVTDFSGRPLSYSPDWTLSVGYTHAFPMGNGGEIEVGARSKISDEYCFLNFVNRAYFCQGDYTRSDADITYNAPNDRWYVQGFVKNIENDLQITTVFGPPSTRRSIQTTAPRTYGVRVGFEF